MAEIGAQPGRLSGNMTITAPDGTVIYSGPFYAHLTPRKDHQDGSDTQHPTSNGNR